ncbi:hypothetical protein AB4K20DRAFT_1919527 [Rhizopus microsporus]|uniref:Uncharacterized protein n=1 Tax=Rhizopus microsporus TaxID=58291 RepID=A0A1X0RU75_RHIZD|nr:hypothetical protein BCV71DRAFT_203116 [Rhizopus microsporus]
MATLFSPFKSMVRRKKLLQYVPDHNHFAMLCRMPIGFYMTQMALNHLFTMTEINRITVPGALSCLHSFITLKKLSYIIAHHPSFFLALLLHSP